jgi:hypothetical protein
MKNGGTVIESGGFGCIFKPQIKCNPKYVIGNNNIYDKNGISKIMRRNNGLDEYIEIKKFIPILKTIPNYNDYFLISQFSICRPNKLTKHDLKHYDLVNCSLLKKKGITKDNINRHLDKLLTLNMPYGGIDLDFYISKILYDYNRIIEFNYKMIELLNNAILPMNQRGIYHSDLKANNILVNNENDDLRFRIIDWGLSTIYLPGKKKDNLDLDLDLDVDFIDDWRYIPKVYRDRPFQFNVPFSCILFSSIFKEMYEQFLMTTNPTKKQIYNFIIMFVKKQIDHRGQGHLSNFKSIFQKMYGTPEYFDTIKSFNINTPNPTNNLDQEKEVNLKHIKYIYKYIFEVLVRFTKNKKFDVLEYLNTVYIKNIDIWGFVMTFLPLTEQLMHYNTIEPSSKLEFYRKLIHKSMKQMIYILLKYSCSPINLNELKDIILLLNKNLQKLSEESVLIQKLKTRQIQSSKIRSKIRSMRRIFTRKINKK